MYMSTVKIFHYVADTAEAAHIVKFELKLLYIQLFRLGICKNERVVYPYLFGFVYAYLHRVLVRKVYFYGKEEQGRLDECLCGSLIYRAENKGITEIELISPGLLFYLLDLALQVLYLLYFRLYRAGALLAADSVVLCLCALRLLAGESRYIGAPLFEAGLYVEIFKDLFLFTVIYERQRISVFRPQKIAEFFYLFVPTLEQTPDVVCVSSGGAFEIETAVVSAYLNEALFVSCVNAFCHRIASVFWGASPDLCKG